MRKLLVGLVMAAGLAYTAGAHAQEVPKFKDYPAKTFSGQEVQVRLDPTLTQEERTRLQQASGEPINFGGRYVFTQWGAGTQCDTGALIDVKTGQVHALPFAACFWQGYDRPFEFRKNSRLMVVAGQVGEVGPRGAHFFEFTGTEFKKVALKTDAPVAAEHGGSVELSTAPVEVVGGVSDVEPAAGDASTTELIARIEANPQMGPLWKCFGQGMDMVAGEVARNSADEKEYIANLALLGGFMKLGDLAAKTCNREIIGDLKGRPMPDYAEKANQFWAAMLLAKDEELFATCKSKTDADWAGIRAICERQEKIFRVRLNSL
ncbi:hypothetical protein [Neorhizobium alkalisoli]|uniref:hypothetical protein n=1 Tax=Neorhizobium alkalisoli TaxID=528178 RepID=UPI000CF9181C|nr:hypothetical protein [Neorhizobium alkalisoli]